MTESGYRAVRVTVEQARQTTIVFDLDEVDYRQWLDGREETRDSVQRYLESGRDYPDFLAECLPDSPWEWEVIQNEIVRCTH